VAVASLRDGLLLFLSHHVGQWPLRVRFALSQASFERAVAKLGEGRSDEIVGQRVGLYRIDRVEPLSNGGWSFVVGYNATDGVGFDFDPSDTSPVYSTSWRIAPRWYTFED
jgi:hypothetical protein